MKLMVSFSVILLSGCTLWTDIFPPKPPAQITELAKRETARIIPAAVCPVSGVGSAAGTTAAVLPALAAAAIPFLVTVVQQSVTAKLEKAEQDLSTTWVAYGTPPISQPVGCLIIARGKFGVGVPSPQGRLTTPILAGIGAAELPSLYVEIAVVQVSNDTRTFEPVFYQYNRTAAKNPGNGEKTVGIIVGFAQKPINSQTPSSDQVQKADIVVPFSLGRLREGTSLLGGGGQARDPFVDQIRSVPTKIGGVDLPSTLNAYAVVSESEDPSAFDAAIQKAAADKSFNDMLTTALKGLSGSTAAAAK
ncbi:hypothetical protein [Caballeronia sp. dw_276]|uniref:hypothetical protein n=1 Tax=Caballeronia sp. dw_276 TaxID=2719795 RepID=UPI001BD4F543|nr:hypothetical protein [Caballeronia sp. dw_276]